MIRLVLSDIDGTLVTPGRRRTSERTIAAIRQLKFAGIEFGPATGRPYRDALAFLGDDPAMLDCAILNNGRTIISAGRIIHDEPISHDDLVAVREVIGAYDGVYICYSITDPESEKGLGCNWHACAPAEDRPTLSRILGELGLDLTFDDEVVEGHCQCAGVVCLPGSQEDVAVYRLGEVLPHIELPSPVACWHDIVPNGRNKAYGLGILLPSLGLSADEVLCIGDSANDLALFAAIPNSACVADGSRRARAAASRVIGGCDDDGPAELMERLACGDFPL